MRVAAEEQRPVDPLLLAVAADRGADRDDVRLGEAAVERRAAVPGGAERHRRRRRPRRDRRRAARRRRPGRPASGSCPARGSTRSRCRTTSTVGAACAPMAVSSSRARRCSISCRRTTARSPRTPAAGRSTPRARSAGSAGRSPTSGACRRTASARRLAGLLAEDGVRARRRSSAPTTRRRWRSPSSTTAARAATASTPRAPPRAGLTPRPRLTALPADVGVLHVGTLGLVLEPMASALEAAGRRRAPGARW